MSEENNAHISDIGRDLQIKQHEISTTLTDERSEKTSKTSEKTMGFLQPKEESKEHKEEEGNNSQVTYELLTKKYLSHKRGRRKKKKAKKSKKVDIEDQYYDQLVKNLLSVEQDNEAEDTKDVDPMMILDLLQKVAVLIESKRDERKPRKKRITKSLEERKKDALETIKTKITVEQFCDLALNVLKIPKMGTSVNITKDDLKAKNINKVEKKLKEYEEANKGKIIQSIVSLTESKPEKIMSVEDMINNDSDLSESLDESESDSDEL